MIYKYLEQLDILKIYMRLKINYGITESFDYFLNNIRSYRGNYTYSRHYNITTFKRNYDSSGIVETTKLYNY